MTNEPAYTLEQLKKVRKKNAILPDWLQIDETRCLKPYRGEKWWEYRSPRFEGPEKASCAPINYDYMSAKTQLKADNCKIQPKEKINNPVKTYSEVLYDLTPWWMELREEANPRGYKFWRKTKAGNWELVTTITNLKDKKFAREWFNMMWLKECSKYTYAAMKVTTLSDRQIYSTYYSNFYRYITYLVTTSFCSFGISINKGEDYFIYHKDFPGDNLKPIADYFCKLSRFHKGIKSFSKAKLDEADNYLYWGWLTFNDGHKISVAVDDKFEFYQSCKDNLQAITTSHLTKIK